MGTSGMTILVISIYKRYGAVLFKGAVQLKLLTNPSISTAVQHNLRVQQKLSKYGNLNIIINVR